MNPIIGITTHRSILSPGFDMKMDVIFTNIKYVEAITTNGGVPLLLTSNTPIHLIDRVVNQLNGIVFTGGQDVHPNSYGHELEVEYKDISDIGTNYIRPLAYAPDIERDQFEISLYQHAKKLGIPILGLCRGMQIINVAEGGTLFQEIDNDYHNLSEENMDCSYHHIDIKENTIAYKIFNEKRYKANSAHHQAIDKLGDSLIVSGYCDDNIIEIIEARDSNFIVGLQSHPEHCLIELPKYNELFVSFIKEATNYAKHK